MKWTASICRCTERRRISRGRNSGFQDRGARANGASPHERYAAPRFFNSSRMTRRRVFSIGSFRSQTYSVQHRLVVSAAGIVRLITEPLHDDGVQPDGDPGLSFLDWNNRPTLRLRKIVFAPHHRSPYSFRSRGVALRAEMRRTESPRHGYTTTRILPKRSAPRVTKRSSSLSCSSGKDNGSSSSSALTASANSTECFRRFWRRFWNQALSSTYRRRAQAPPAEKR
jgi:hypothetical protein